MSGTQQNIGISSIHVISGDSIDLDVSAIYPWKSLPADILLCSDNYG